MIHPRLLWGIEEILDAGFDTLKDPTQIEMIIKGIGLSAGPWAFSSRDQVYCLAGAGLMQSSQEMADLLVMLSNYPVRTALEIGSFIGWTAAVMAAYLCRWSPCLTFQSIDTRVWGSHDERHALSRILPLTFAQSSSLEYYGQSFDFCFIDGDHAYEAVKADYLHVGQYATICAFHDITGHRSTPVQPEVNGVPRFWQELKQSSGARDRFHEISHAPPGRPHLGIGVRIRA